MGRRGHSLERAKPRMLCPSPTNVAPGHKEKRTQKVLEKEAGGLALASLMDYSIDWWDNRGQREWGAAINFLQGKNRQPSTQTQN